MNKVTTINLNGKAYQIEEGGYTLLHSYLTSTEAKLASNPDKDEIMADFEQAIAEKCGQYLNPHKNVIALKEIETILLEMGPVETEDTSSPETPKEGARSSRKRLYLIKEGSILGGVCTGLAAYFDTDVTMVRLLFIILAFFTSGFWILVYIVMWIIVPRAKTPEQKAEARGESFSANRLIEKLRSKYASLEKKS